MKSIILIVLLNIILVQSNFTQILVNITPMYKVYSLYEPILVKVEMINQNNSNEVIFGETSYVLDIEAKTKLNSNWFDITSYQVSESGHHKTEFKDTLIYYQIIEPYRLRWRTKIEGITSIEIRGKYYLGEGQSRVTKSIKIKPKNIKKDIKLIKNIEQDHTVYAFEYFNRHNKKLKSMKKINNSKVNSIINLPRHLASTANLNDYYMSDEVDESSRNKFVEEVIEKDIKYYESVIRESNYNLEKQLAMYYKKINEISLSIIYAHTLMDICFNDLQIEDKDRVTFCKNTYQKYYKNFDYHYDKNLFNMNEYISNVIEEKLNQTKK